MDLLSKTICVVFLFILVGLEWVIRNAVQSPTLTRPFPLDSVVQFLFYLLGIDKCQKLKQYIISLDWLRYCSRSLLLLKSDEEH